MLISETEPEIAVTVEASITPVVLPSSVFNTEEASDVSLKVTASSPNPLIPDDA